MKTMNFKRKIVLVLMACMLAACFTLVGCGGGGGAADFVGDWKLTEMVEDGEAMSGDDLELMEEMGLTFGLTINDDGSAVIDMFGETLDGTWEAAGDSAVDLTFEGETLQAKMVDGKVVLEEGGSKMVFSKK